MKKRTLSTVVCAIIIAANTQAISACPPKRVAVRVPSNWELRVKAENEDRVAVFRKNLSLYRDTYLRLSPEKIQG